MFSCLLPGEGSKHSFRQDAAEGVAAAPPRAPRAKRTSGRLCDRVRGFFLFVFVELILRQKEMRHFFKEITAALSSSRRSPPGGALLGARLCSCLPPHLHCLMSHSVFQSRSLCTSPLPEPSPSLTSSSSSSPSEWGPQPSDWGVQNRSASPARVGQGSPLPYQHQDHQRQCTSPGSGCLRAPACS